MNTSLNFLLFSMNAEQLAVQDFMRAYGQTVRTSPNIKLSDTELKLRIDLIAEEFDELQAALVAEDIVEVADAIGDLLYVIYGAAATFGMDAQQIFSEIHSSNMSKFWLNNEIATEFNRDAQEVHQYTGTASFENDNLIAQKIARNRWIVKNKDGKIIKSPSFKAPNLKGLVSFQAR